MLSQFCWTVVLQIFAQATLVAGQTGAFSLDSSGSGSQEPAVGQEALADLLLKQQPKGQAVPATQSGLSELQRAALAELQRATPAAQRAALSELQRAAPAAKRTEPIEQKTTPSAGLRASPAGQRADLPGQQAQTAEKRSDAARASASAAQSMPTKPQSTVTANQQRAEQASQQTDRKEKLAQATADLKAQLAQSKGQAAGQAAGKPAAPSSMQSSGPSMLRATSGKNPGASASSSAATLAGRGAPSTGQAASASAMGRAAPSAQSAQRELQKAALERMQAARGSLAAKQAVKKKDAEEEEHDKIAASIMRRFDTDGDGKVSLYELIDHVGDLHHKEFQGWHSGFSQADADDDMYLTIEELTSLLKNVRTQEKEAQEAQQRNAKKQTTMIAASILQGLDSNGDGKISLQELLNNLNDGHHQHPAFRGWHKGFKEADADNDMHLTVDELASLLMQTDLMHNEEEL